MCSSNRFATLVYSDSSDDEANHASPVHTASHVKQQLTVLSSALRSQTSLSSALRSQTSLSEISNTPIYSIRVGSQPIKFEANDPIPFSFYDGLAHSSFYTKCIYCQYMTHSEKQCPLNQCL